MSDPEQADPEQALPSAVCDGGPHIVVPADLASGWRGAIGAGTDYSRACDVAEPVGIISVGRGCALVIGGSPPFTYWVSEEPGFSSGALVVPRSWASDFTASQLRTVCEQTPASGFRDLGLVFQNESSKCLLFAACDAGPEWVYGYSRFPLARGCYRVLFAEAHLGQSLEVSIIRLASMPAA